MIVKFDKKSKFLSMDLVVSGVNISRERFDLPRLPERGEAVIVKSTERVTVLGTVDSITTHATHEEVLYIITIDVI